MLFEYSQKYVITHVYPDNITENIPQLVNISAFSEYKNVRFYNMTYMRTGCHVLGHP